MALPRDIETGGKHTQLFLKQSCEQKKLPLMPSLMQVGHWRASASLSQPTPRHVRGAEVILRGGLGVCRISTQYRCPGRTTCTYDYVWGAIVGGRKRFGKIEGKKNCGSAEVPDQESRQWQWLARQGAPADSLNRWGGEGDEENFCRILSTVSRRFTHPTLAPSCTL